MQRCVGGPVHPIEVYIPTILDQLSLGGLKADDCKVCLGNVSFTGRIQIDVLKVNNVQGWMVLDHLFFFNLGYANLLSNGPDLVFHRVLDRFLQSFRSFRETLRVGFCQLSSLLQLLNDLWILLCDILPDRNLNELDLGVSLPSKLYHHCAFIDRGSDVVIDELDHIELGTELVVQNQLVLLGSLLVFPGNRSHSKGLL